MEKLDRLIWNFLEAMSKILVLALCTAHTTQCVVHFICATQEQKYTVKSGPMRRALYMCRDLHSMANRMWFHTQSRFSHWLFLSSKVWLVLMMSLGANELFEYEDILYTQRNLIFFWQTHFLCFRTLALSCFKMNSVLLVSFDFLTEWWNLSIFAGIVGMRSLQRWPGLCLKNFTTEEPLKLTLCLLQKMKLTIFLQNRVLKKNHYQAL